MTRPNWRASYQSQTKSHVDQMSEWRRNGVAHSVELPNRKVKYVFQLTDAEILDLAYLEAERDVNRAIYEWNHAQEHKR